MGVVASVPNPEETQHPHLGFPDGMDELTLLMEVVDQKGANMENEEKRNDVSGADEPPDSDETDRRPIAQTTAAAEAEVGEADSQKQREVAKHYKEMVELGANIKGEGEIE
jgi:hypothetical protein